MCIRDREGGGGAESGGCADAAERERRTREREAREGRGRREDGGVGAPQLESSAALELSPDVSSSRCSVQKLMDVLQRSRIASKRYPARIKAHQSLRFRPPEFIR
eukprot:3105331-Rhodomonas_salina.1